MNAFKFTELEDGETIVFGPVTFTKTTNLSGGTGPTQSSVSKTSGRAVGITSQRIVVEDIESPEKTQVVRNADVQRVFVKRKQSGGRSTITLTKAQTGSGQAVKLEIKGLPAQAETLLQSTFPNAEIVQDKKCFIATAAYGSSVAPEVATLRRFRDTRLRRDRLGRWALRIYERYSPPLADWIAERRVVRFWVQRLVLSPTLWVAHHWMR